MSKANLESLIQPFRLLKTFTVEQKAEPRLAQASSMPVEQTQRNPAIMGNKTSQSSGTWKLKERGRVLPAEHPGAVWKESQL